MLVYLDTPLAVIEERRTENSRTRARTSVPDAKIRTDMSLLDPPEEAEHAIRVSPGYVLPEVLAQVRPAWPGVNRKYGISPVFLQASQRLA